MKKTIVAVFTACMMLTSDTAAYASSAPVSEKKHEECRLL